MHRCEKKMNILSELQNAMQTVEKNSAHKEKRKIRLDQLFGKKNLLPS